MVQLKIEKNPSFKLLFLIDNTITKLRVIIEQIKKEIKLNLSENIIINNMIYHIKVKI